MLSQQRLILIVSAVILCGLTILFAGPKLRDNLGRVIVLKLIDAQSLTITEREWGAKLAKVLLQRGSPSYTDQQIIEKADSCEWQNLMLMAYESLRRKEDSNVGFWLNLASNRGDVSSELHGSYPPWYLMLRPNGDAGISWSSPFWRLRKDSDDGSVQYDEEHDVLRLSYESQPNLDKRLIYSFAGSINPDRWDTLELEAKVPTDTFVTLALHTNQGVERKMVRQKGTDSWEIYRFHLADREIRFIYLSISGPSDGSIATVHSAEFKPIKLILMDTSANCSSKEL